MLEEGDQVEVIPAMHHGDLYEFDGCIGKITELIFSNIETKAIVKVSGGNRAGLHKLPLKVLKKL